MVSYTYDAWGKPISKTGTLASTLGTIQPFRYRGYVYDEEMELYYLQNRYFDPLMSRFVNCDKTLGDSTNIVAHNMYAYCGNNPIEYVDYSGNLFGLSLFTIVTTAAVGAFAGFVTQMATNIVTGAEWHEGLIGATVGGAVYNTVSVLSYGDTALAAYASAAAESFTNEIVSYTPLAGESQKELTMNNVCDSMDKIATDTLVNGTGYFLTGKVADVLSPVTANPNPRKRHIRTVMNTEWGKQMFKQTVVQSMYNLNFGIGKQMLPMLN